MPSAPYSHAAVPPGFRGPAADGGTAVCLDRGLRGVRVYASGCRFEIFALEAGAPRKQRGTGAARPPLYIHFVLYGAPRSLSRMLPFAWPRVSKQTGLNGVFARRRTTALPLGSVTVGAHRAQLVLAPPFPIGGELGDHLVLRWRQDGNDYAASLHGWEPLAEAAATLRAIAASAPGTKR